MKKIFILFALLLSACAPKTPAALTVMTHDSFAVSEEVIKAFEDAHQTKVVFLQGGDTGSALNKAILSKDAPLADLFFGVDNTFLSRALDEDIFEPYESPALKNIPAEFQLDDTRRALPIDYGDVCINYDKKYFAERNLAAPNSFEDLTKPEYNGLLVTENPALSSPGLAFLLATRAYFGEGYLDYWKSLKANGLVIVDDWETAYYSNFSASSGQGAQPLVVSYASSPAAEVAFASEPLDDSPTAAIVAPRMCFRQIEFAGILKNGKNRDLAEKFIDFMLSERFQEDMPLTMFVYPIDPTAKLPNVFTRYARSAPQPAAISFEEIAANRDAWIEAWMQAMK